MYLAISAMILGMEIAAVVAVVLFMRHTLGRRPQTERLTQADQLAHMLAEAYAAARQGHQHAQRIGQSDDPREMAIGVAVAKAHEDMQESLRAAARLTLEARPESSDEVCRILVVGWTAMARNIDQALAGGGAADGE